MSLHRSVCSRSADFFSQSGKRKGKKKLVGNPSFRRHLAIFKGNFLLLASRHLELEAKGRKAERGEEKARGFIHHHRHRQGRGRGHHLAGGGRGSVTRILRQMSVLISSFHFPRQSSKLPLLSVSASWEKRGMTKVNRWIGHNHGLHVSSYLQLCQ